MACVVVSDTGCGIEAGNLTKIFAHGFTTRADGHGFGLHFCAIAARQMKGNLVAESGGVGQGARFTLEIPLQQLEATRS
jgi:signal transduction histidine kinase